MADSIPTDFVGGPCDGQTHPLSTAQLRTGAASCGGSNYIIQGVTPTLYRATYAKDVESQEKLSPLGGHAQFDTAWAQLMRTLAFGIPDATRSLNASVLRLRKAVR